MFKLTIRHIPNTLDFIQEIRQSKGSVCARLSDGTLCSLKQEPAALGLLQLLSPGPGGLELFLSDSTDFSRFFHYLLNSADPDRDRSRLGSAQPCFLN